MKKERSNIRKDNARLIIGQILLILASGAKGYADGCSNYQRQHKTYIQFGNTFYGSDGSTVTFY